MDGEHVNGQTHVCHVVLRLFKCRQMPHTPKASSAVQIASPQNAIIANCTDTFLLLRTNPLFLKDLIAVRLLAC
ncbi:hypothetical protein FQ192_05835 [Pseudomonas sp. ANT_J12]|nr:hypothetical protein FQ192_05835 [Pseudomonas sp. ANT_J12]